MTPCPATWPAWCPRQRHVQRVLVSTAFKSHWQVGEVTQIGVEVDVLAEPDSSTNFEELDSSDAINITVFPAPDL